MLGIQVRWSEYKQSKDRPRHPAKEKGAHKVQKATKSRIIHEKNQRPENIQEIVNSGQDQGRRRQT